MNALKTSFEDKTVIMAAIMLRNDSYDSSLLATVFCCWCFFLFFYPSAPL